MPLLSLNLQAVWAIKRTTAVPSMLTVWLSSSLYENPRQVAGVPLQGPQCPLQTRILFHCAHKTGQEEKLMECHQQLGDSLEDQLSLGSIHYLRGHYQVAT